jgi:hypothetical protein
VRPARAARALVGLLGLGAALSCSAQQRPEAVAVDRSPDDEARRADIRDLWFQIRDWRVESGMATEPEPIERAFQAKAVHSLRQCGIGAAAEEPRGTCADVCNLKDAICDNADSICRIADELDGDDWAADKCKSAKSSCKEATERCCACTGGDAPAPAR